MLNKIQNIFLKEETTEILFDRDSVCMGDDCMSHIKTVQVEQKSFISDLLHQLADYVPSMKNVVWMVKEQNEIIGFIEMDEDANAKVYVNGKDTPIGTRFEKKELFCRYYYSSIFTWIDGKTGEHINKYTDCSTLLEKVMKDNNIGEFVFAERR